MNNFGAFLTELRMKAGFGLRPFAEMVEMKPSNLSALEHGRRQPPSDADKLQQMASVLGLVEGSSDWVKFFDLARQADALPADVSHMANKPLVPVLLRTIDNRQLSDKQIEDLIRHVQEGRRSK